MRLRQDGHRILGRQKSMWHEKACWQVSKRLGGGGHEPFGLQGIITCIYIYIYCCIFNIWMIARRPSLLGSTSELAMEVVVSPVLCEELSAAPDFPGASWHRLIQKCVKTTSVKLVNTSCLSKHRVIRSLENHEHQNSRCALSKFLWGNWRACQGFSNQSFVL